MKSRILPIIAGSFGLICVLQLTNLSLAQADEEVKESVSNNTTSQEAISSSHKNEPTKTASLGNFDDLPDQVCVTSAMADAILQEQSRIDKRKLELAKREKALSALETRLDEQLNNIQQTKSSVQAQLDRIETIATDDLKHLITMYETMKPKKAAEIFDSMAPSFAAGFLRDMNSAKAGMIMSEMNAKKSYEISLVIANRNAQLRKSVQ